MIIAFSYKHIIFPLFCMLTASCFSRLIMCGCFFICSQLVFLSLESIVSAKLFLEETISVNQLLCLWFFLPWCHRYPSAAYLSVLNVNRIGKATVNAPGNIDILIRWWPSIVFWPFHCMTLLYKVLNTVDPLYLCTIQ